jgi:hypothetical protein
MQAVPLVFLGGQLAFAVATKLRVRALRSTSCCAGPLACGTVYGLCTVPACCGRVHAGVLEVVAPRIVARAGAVHRGFPAHASVRVSGICCVLLPQCSAFHACVTDCAMFRGSLL